MPDDTRLQNIEFKIAFQERLLEQLNEALTGQQKQLDALQRHLRDINRNIESQNEQFSRPDEEAPPPHY